MSWNLSFRNLKFKKFRVYKQSNIMDCGPTCLQMIASFYGKYYNVETLRELCGISNTGVNMLGISEGAKRIGLQATGLKVTLKQLLTEVSHPSILYWQQKHFVVFLSGKKRFGKYKITIADPAQGKIQLSKEEFLQMWSNNIDEDGDPFGFTLIMRPQNEFYTFKGERKFMFSWKYVLRYFANDYSKLFYILITIIFSIVGQLAVPFLTKLLVDDAIRLRNVHLITLIILAQFGILFGKLIADFLRAKFLLVISTFINIEMSADFWKKLMRLPLSFFEIRRGGDVFQRLSDTKQVQNFLTGPAVNTTFSVLTFLTFAYILFSYKEIFLLVFLGGMLIYYLWISLFFNIRKKINHNMNELTTNQNDLSFQLVNGMSEIRIGGGEAILLRAWDELQNKLFLLNSKALRISQIQTTGGLIISQGKDLLIIFIAASLVVEKHLSLGSLIAIQYIIGALTSPIEQLIVFSQNVVDAKQSINRLNDVYQLKNENKGTFKDFLWDGSDNDIKINRLSFAYPGVGNKFVLKNLCLTIPAGKVTAIVGLSGSGKTTLFKLLLKFYAEYKGEISIGDRDISVINSEIWRKKCGAVLQDGYVFNNTIERNIAVGDETIDHQQLLLSCELANILTFIESLPNKFQTKLGVDGMNLSQGQKQRMLIARALYKKPSYLFFDEATNSLDAENERLIVENLKQVYSGKTVIIIAHRLSTVKDADKIVVLDKGEIVEEGTHQELVLQNGVYLKLVKNQLSLSI